LIGREQRRAAAEGANTQKLSGKRTDQRKTGWFSQTLESGSGKFTGYPPKVRTDLLAEP